MDVLGRASEARFDLSLGTYLTSASSVRAGQGEIVVTVAGNGPGPLPVRFEGLASQTGNLFASVLADVGNDGSFDWQFGTGFALAGSAPDIVGQPLQVRFRFEATATTPGGASFDLVLRVLPDNGIYVFPIPTNCGLSNRFTVRTLFDNTLSDIVTRSDGTAWHVLGLSPQPTLLPPALTQTGVPCLLVPAPDAAIRTGTLFLPIPPALRPITLHAQLLDIVPALRVSETYQILAL